MLYAAFKFKKENQNLQTWTFLKKLTKIDSFSWANCFRVLVNFVTADSKALAHRVNDDYHVDYLTSKALVLHGTA